MALVKKTAPLSGSKFRQNYFARSKTKTKAGDVLLLIENDLPKKAVNRRGRPQPHLRPDFQEVPAVIGTHVVGT